MLVTEPAKEEREARTTTMERLKVIKQRLADYYTRNGYFPCVADRTAAFGDADYGRVIHADCVADTSVPAGGGTLRVANGSFYVRIGAVPTRDLLLPDEYMEDAFGNKFTYAVTEEETSTVSGAFGRIIIEDEADAFVTKGASYIVFSHGVDGKGAYRGSSGSLQTACGASTNLDVESCDEDATFRLTELTDKQVAAAAFYDDMATWYDNPAPRFTLIRRTPSSTWSFPMFNVLGDVNGDGKAEVFTTTQSGIYVGHGNESMPDELVFPTNANTTFTTLWYRIDTGDINGDGIDDFFYANQGPNMPLRIVFGDNDADGPYGSGSVDLSTLISPPTGAIINPAVSTGYVYAYAVGDFDGNGTNDLILNNSTRDNQLGETGVGAMGIFLNKTDWTASPYNFEDADFIIEGKQWYAGYIGNYGEIYAGDINGDGKDDFCGSTTNATNTFCFFGKPTGDWSGSPVLINALVTGGGGVAITNFAKVGAQGYYMNMGDFNCDGKQDLANGKGDILLGRASFGTSLDYSTQTAGTEKLTITDLPAFVYAGYPIFADINNDGCDDLFITNPTGAGVAYLVFGREDPDDTISVAAPDGSSVVQFNGSIANMKWGDRAWHWRAHDVGDVDGDGFEDVVIPSISGTSTDPNHAWIIYGKSGTWPATVDLADYIP
jgi:hypothetical protein